MYGIRKGHKHNTANEQERKSELKDLGLTDGEWQGDAKPPKRKKRVCLCLMAVFVLSLVVGIMVSEFMGPGGILAGLLIGAAIGVVIAVLPLIIYLITH